MVETPRLPRIRVARLNVERANNIAKECSEAVKDIKDPIDRAIAFFQCERSKNNLPPFSEKDIQKIRDSIVSNIKGLYERARNL